MKILKNNLLFTALLTAIVTGSVVIGTASIVNKWLIQTSSERPIEQQVRKWVDPANDVVIYIAPEGYQIVIMPAYVAIPPMYAQYALDLYVMQNQKLPPLSNYPDEWLEALKVYGKFPVGSLDLNIDN